MQYIILLSSAKQFFLYLKNPLQVLRLPVWAPKSKTVLLQIAALTDLRFVLVCLLQTCDVNS